LTSSRPGRRRRAGGSARFLGYILASLVLPGRKRIVPYSIQWLMRLRPAMFRQDLTALFELLRQHQIKPLVAERLPLVEAKRAHELLERGGVMGKIVLVCDGRAAA